eukprot:202508-Prymnesium_polylepis.1
MSPRTPPLGRALASRFRGDLGAQNNLSAPAAPAKVAVQAAVRVASDAEGSFPTPDPRRTSHPPRCRESDCVSWWQANPASRPRWSHPRRRDP